VPEDIERLFAAVLLHRIVFRPTFLAEARRIGWAAAVASVQEKCFGAVPRPKAEQEEEQRPPERLLVGQQTTEPTTE